MKIQNTEHLKHDAHDVLGVFYFMFDFNTEDDILNQVRKATFKLTSFWNRVPLCTCSPRCDIKC